MKMINDKRKEKIELKRKEEMNIWNIDNTLNEFTTSTQFSSKNQWIFQVISRGECYVVIVDCRHKYI